MVYHINRIIDVIIPIDSEKVFNKIQYSLMIKILNKVVERNYLNMVMAIYEKTTVSIVFYSEKHKDLPLRSNKEKMLTLATLFNIVLELLAKAISQEKDIKGIQIRKEEVK